MDQLTFDEQLRRVRRLFIHELRPELRRRRYFRSPGQTRRYKAMLARRRRRRELRARL